MTVKPSADGPAAWKIWPSGIIVLAPCTAISTVSNCSFTPHTPGPFYFQVMQRPLVVGPPKAILHPKLHSPRPFAKRDVIFPYWEWMTGTRTHHRCAVAGGPPRGFGLVQVIKPQHCLHAPALLIRWLLSHPVLNSHSSTDAQEDVCSAVMRRVANWNRFSSSSGTFQFKRRSDTLAVSSIFDLQLTTGSASNQSSRYHLRFADLVVLRRPILTRAPSEAEKFQNLRFGTSEIR